MERRPTRTQPDPAAATAAKLSSTDVPTPVQADELTDQPRWTKAMTMTIDGPAGSGKSTIARMVAESIGFQYLETGATYRALGWLALDRGIPLDDAARLRGLAIAQPAMLGFEVDRWTVRIAGIDVTDAIREPQIDDAASRVAAHDEVRDVLVARQRQLSMARDSVLDGRDCGTRVRPDADLKIFITADFDERVRRRSAQHADEADTKVADSIRERDQRDAPQSGAATDAVLIDSTSATPEQLVEQIVGMWIKRRHELLDDERVGARSAKEWIENDHLPKFQKAVKYTGLLWRRGFRLQAHGIERVPEGPALFIANHSSMWDPAFLTVPLLRPIRYMAKRELMDTPVVKDFGDAIGFFPVRRGNGDRVAMHIAESVLRRGDSLGIFPEGTRVYEGRLARPKQGAARLALVTGTPIVPVAIYGNRWRESLFRVSVAFGRPHYFDGQAATPANVARATNDVWSDVEELWDALKSERWF